MALNGVSKHRQHFLKKLLISTIKLVGFFLVYSVAGAILMSKIYEFYHKLHCDVFWSDNKKLFNKTCIAIVKRVFLLIYSKIFLSICEKFRFLYNFKFVKIFTVLSYLEMSSLIFIFEKINRYQMLMNETRIILIFFCLVVWILLWKDTNLKLSVILYLLIYYSSVLLFKIIYKICIACIKFILKSSVFSYFTHILGSPTKYYIYIYYRMFPYWPQQNRITITYDNLTKSFSFQSQI